MAGEGPLEPLSEIPGSTVPALAIRALHRRRGLFVPKSREMMASWSVVGYAVWTCQFFPRQRVIVQSQKEDKVADLIKGVGNPGYARTLVERQPSWLREKYP